MQKPSKNPQEDLPQNQEWLPVFPTKEEESNALTNIFQLRLQAYAFLCLRLVWIVGWLWNKPQAPQSTHRMLRLRPTWDIKIAKGR